MYGAVANHLWQSTIFAVVAALFTIALRKNRAQIRFRLWFCASLKFLLPFSLLMSLGTYWQAVPAAKRAAEPIASAAVMQMSRPFAEFDFQPIVPAAPQRRDWVGIGMIAAWACGFALIAAIRLKEWRRIQAALRASTPMNIAAPVDVRSAPGLLEPGAVGWLRPAVLLPSGIEEQLPPAQLAAVLTHELCHIRRRDNLTSAIHMFVEAVFWFHPLVWWIGARLVEERELACDEEALRETGDSKAYAEAILNVCKRYVESPLACVSGVSRANLKRRIEAIVMDRKLLQLSFLKKAAIAVTGMAALALPLLVGVASAPSTPAQSSETPRFTTASIRPNVHCDDADSTVAAGGGAKRGGTKSKKKRDGDPGVLHIRCAVLGGEHGLIRQAYVVFAGGQLSVRIPSPALSGGPDWLDSATFDIEATADSETSAEMMRGPMLQRMLEDKLKLKLRNETRESPAYALVASENEPRLRAFQEGSCTPVDFSRSLAMHETSGAKRCSFFVGISPAVGPVPATVAQGVTLHDFAKVLSWAVGRPVIDATGIAGRFDFHLEFQPDENTPGMRELAELKGAGGTTRPPILEAIQQQYGLKLVPSQAPREFLVVEHVEKPLVN